ncbi:MAG: N-acetylmuramoyl-L-alanine amidase [Limnochordia bacterium]|jgi:N-acetylmuramoyl-L-alanine amidase|nr:N-acetylmuramoyl-L-alanine amidase [Limnochordia bacterium]
MKICIDSGHGGSDPGAVGMYGTKEADINLEVGLILRELLKKRGAEIIMTRESNRFIGLTERTRIANAAKAEAFISIHCNASVNRQAHGFEIYTSPGQTKADPLATSIYDAWEVTFPDHKLRADWSDGDPDKEANFTVLRRTIMPAVLVELDFISNPNMEAWMNQKHNQAQMAQTIMAGLFNWYGR